LPPKAAKIRLPELVRLAPHNGARRELKNRQRTGKISARTIFCKSRKEKFLEHSQEAALAAS